MNYLFISRVFFYFDLVNPFFISLLLTLTVPLAMVLAMRKYTKFNAYFYKASMIWFGVVIIGLVSTVIVELLQLVISINLPLGFVILGLVVVISGISLLAGSRIRVDTKTITSSKLKQHYTIVHLTDLHLQGLNAKKKFERIYNKAVSLKPDIIVITGDLFDGPGKIPQDTITIVSKDIPTVFVMGNHDFYIGDDYVKKLISKSNIIFLRSSTHTLNELQFIGIDDAEDKQQVQKELSMISYDKKKFTVLLYHRPDGVSFASTQDIDLMLCGHTHSGQIFPGNLLVKLRHKYVRGLYHIGKLILYVHTGTGTWGPPMRLGSWNKITVLNLEKK